MTEPGSGLMAYIVGADVRASACAHCGDGSAMAGEWVALSSEGTMVVGLAMWCDSCAPEGKWLCHFCPVAVAMDGVAVFEHLSACIGAHRA